MRIAAIAALVAGVLSASVRAEDVGCTATSFRIFGANDRVCVQAFDDPGVAGVSCYVSQARTGGVKGSLGVAEDPSRFAVSCRQTGPIVLPARLPAEESVFSASTSLVWKDTKVIRMFDAKRNTLVYVAISRKLIDGSPMNAVSAVPIAKWEPR